VLLMIDGQPVLGTAALMSALGQTGETVQLGSATRIINYGAGDPRLPPLTFAEAKCRRARWPSKPSEKTSKLFPNKVWWKLTCERS
jgi:hypothetical protein